MLKGRGNFYTIVYDIKRSCVLKIIEGRSFEKLKPYFDSLTEGERRRVQNITMDMCSTFIKVGEKYFPWARITVDRFHVEKEIQEILKKVKNREKLESKKDVKDDVVWVHYELLKKNEKLSDEQREDLKIFLNNPYAHDTLEIYYLKEEIKKIFDSKISRSKAKKLMKKILNKMKKLGIKELKGFIKTFKRLFGYILNYFRLRLTNGKAEGMNNKIKKIKRDCFGFRNIENFETRVIINFLPDTAI